jgi:tetratricopeptide (TPR) repeat protein
MESAMTPRAQRARSRLRSRFSLPLKLPLLVALAALLLPVPGLAEEAPRVRQEFMQRLGSGARALDQGNAVAAVEDLCWAARRGLNSHRAHLMCGMALTQAHRPEEAISHLELASELNDQHLPTWIALGDAYLAAGRIDSSRAAYFQALEIRTDYAPAYVGLGELAVRRGDEETALEMFAKALQANPAEARAYVARARLHVDEGRQDQALQDLRRAVELRPDDGVVQRALARVLLLNGLTQEAIGAARSARELRPQDPRVAALLARIYLQLDAVPEAEEEARKALELDTHLAEARIVLADVLGRTGRVDEALGILEPPDPSLLSAPELENLEQARERWRTRREEIQQLLARLEAPEEEQVEPLTSAERVQLARALLETGREQRAVRVAEPLIERADLPADLRRQIGSLMLDAGFPLEAAGLLDPLVGSGEAEPSDVLALARALERSGGIERAEDLFRSLLGEPSKQIAAESHAGLARLAWWRGDLQAAVEHLRAHADAVASEPARARAQEAIRRLESLLELRAGAAQSGGDS